MKRLLFFLILTLSAHGQILSGILGGSAAAPSAAVLIQKASNNASSGGGATVAVTVSATGTHHLLVAFGVFTQGTTAVTITSSNNTWTAITGINSSTACFHSQFTNAGCAAAYSCDSVAGDTAVNFASGGFAAITGIVYEYSGVQTTSCLDQVSALTGVTSTSPMTSNTITTGQKDLLIGLATGNNPQGFGAGAGWGDAQTQVDTAGATTDAIMEDKLSTVAGTYSAAATVSGSSGGGIGIISFKLL